ncbi:MAG: hypothetical protein JJ896_15635 [Rhodothermales bacterium]|nr:hypothetical protein [Rhodothermales bacterium]MBO6781087.1 hypothetical protein [Rhodothermales bacterium]
MTTDQERRERAEAQIWKTLGILWNRRVLIITITGLMAVASVVISLMLPNYYRAMSRLLLPESGGGGLASAVLGNLGSAARSFLGASGGDYVRYLAILQSRNVLSAVVEEFDLVTVYELQDSDTPLDDAIEELADRVDFYVDNEYDFLSIEVVDRDPQRAADMANFMLQELDRVNNELASRTAGNFRQYVEMRFAESERSRGAMLDSLKAFQQRYGVFDLQAQTEAFFDQLAEMRVAAIEAEVQYEALRSQLGDNNTAVQNMKEVVDASNRKYYAALAGREEILPVPQSDVPIAVREFADLEMRRVIEEKILEFVAPVLEQARFEEQQQKEALQIVDPAVPPVRKDSPKRSIIVIAATASAFILVVLYALLSAWWNANAEDYARKLSEASEKVRRA